MYKELLTSLHRDTFVISLNRSSKLNAFTKTMQDELIKVFDYTDQNDDIKHSQEQQIPNYLPLLPG